MRSAFQRFTALVVLLVLALTFSSCSLSFRQGAAPKYRATKGGCGLYRYKSTSAEDTLVVPDVHEGRPVTELLPFCAANAEYLKKIVIGKNVETISPWAMTNCPHLKEISVDPGNENFVSVDGVLYSRDMTRLVFYPNARSPIVWGGDGAYLSGGGFTVPDAVEEIGENAFYLCSDLYSAELGGGLKKVGDKAFLKCVHLRALRLPDSLTEIGADAFSYCDALTELEIPSSVKKIGDYAFFSTASSIERIIVYQDGAEALELGRDWIPNKKKSVRSKVEVEFAGRRTPQAAQ